MTATGLQPDGTARHDGESASMNTLLYRWFARLFGHELDAETLALYQSGPGRAVIEDLAGHPTYAAGATRLAERLGRLDSDPSPVLTLAAAYGRLFHGGGGRAAVAPYESVYEDDRGATHGKAWRRMQALLGALALEPPTSFREPADHVAIELSVMATLSERAEAGADDAGEAAAQRDRFLAEHLLPWVPRFCAATIEADRDGFYAAAAELLAGHLRQEKEMRQPA